ncbi:MAG: hypothetical protein HYY04_09305 [Chloroflexi bacterium]|nr:hypothetical protein [Chloroflexota bacterium]
MSVLGRLIGTIFGGGGGSRNGDDHAMHYFVKCKKCGEKFRVRIDHRWDLSQEFDDGGSGDAVSGYSVTKSLVGSRCFRPITLQIQFDRGRREASRTIDGGEFISREEYEATGEADVPATR